MVQAKHTGVRIVSKSSIEIAFTFEKRFYRERVKLTPTEKNLAAAVQMRKAIYEAIADNRFFYSQFFPQSKNAIKFKHKDNPGLLLKHYLLSWLEDKKQQLKASTFRNYDKTTKNQIIPALGFYNLAELKPKHVKAWVKTLNCGNERIINIIAIIKSAMKDALEDEMIEINSLAGWKYKKKQEIKKERVKPFSKQEQEKLLKTLTGQNKNIMQFAFWTGLRTSELIALRWSDINWQKKEVHINKSKTQVSAVDEVPKTKKSIRFVKLLPEALSALQDQKQYKNSQDDHIFLNPHTNRPWEGDGDIRNQLWIPAINRAEVEYRNPYQTRHTYASMMLSASEPLAWIAEQMGHSDTSMLSRRYGKWMPDAAPAAGMAASNLYGHG